MKRGKIYIEYADGTKFLKEKILCGGKGFMATDDNGNRIWIWIEEDGEE